MIDPVAPWASGFLYATSALFLFVYALPILFMPLRWARWFRWQVDARDEDNHLLLYFARCLGAVALALVGCFAAIAPRASQHGRFFDLIVVVGVLLAGVHVWGAVRKQQPWTETAEIGLYAGAALAAWLLHP